MNLYQEMPFDLKLNEQKVKKDLIIVLGSAISLSSCYSNPSSSLYAGREGQLIDGIIIEYYLINSKMEAVTNVAHVN